MTHGLLLLAATLTLEDHSSTQTARQEFNTLKTFRCDFTESEGRRTSAAGVTTSATQETFSDLVIDNVDYTKRSARFIGNAGSETVTLFDGPRTVSFLEEAPVGGNVNVSSSWNSCGDCFVRPNACGSLVAAARQTAKLPSCHRGH